MFSPDEPKPQGSSRHTTTRSLGGRTDAVSYALLTTNRPVPPSDDKLAIQHAPLARRLPHRQVWEGTRGVAFCRPALRRLKSGFQAHKLSTRFSLPSGSGLRAFFCQGGASVFYRYKTWSSVGMRGNLHSRQTGAAPHLLQGCPHDTVGARATGLSDRTLSWELLDQCSGFQLALPRCNLYRTRF